MYKIIKKIITASVAVIVIVLSVFIVRDTLLAPTKQQLTSVRTESSIAKSDLTSASSSTSATSLESRALWSINGKTFVLDMAKTMPAQELGLGGRDSLASTSGMLFIFDSPSNYGFWMKDMKFSLDIIWLDQNYKIIYIGHDISSITYPEVFYPGSPAKYVIEVNAGTAEKLSLKIGQIMQIQDQ